MERQGCEEIIYHIKGCCFEGFKLKLIYMFYFFFFFQVLIVGIEGCFITKK